MLGHPQPLASLVTIAFHFQMTSIDKTIKNEEDLGGFSKTIFFHVKASTEVSVKFDKIKQGKLPQLNAISEVLAILLRRYQISNTRKMQMYH